MVGQVPFFSEIGDDASNNQRSEKREKSHRPTHLVCKSYTDLSIKRRAVEAGTGLKVRREVLRCQSDDIEGRKFGGPEVGFRKIGFCWQYVESTMGNLSNKRALVTGAAGGIGTAITQALQAQGVIVTGVDRENGDADHFIVGNLMDAAFCDGLPSKAAKLMGGLDILVNNAGIITRGKITEASDDDLRRTIGVNVEAPFRLCRATIPIMADAGSGAIVNVASCWGVHPGPDHPLYVMSKAAIASLTQCLGRDHAHQNIRVNAVCPNEVNTPMLRTGFAIRGFDPDSAIEKLNATVPLGRIAEPDDIADVVVFLASDQARYLCGALIEANGGKPVG